MRILLAATPRCPTRREALPGLVTKRRSLTAALAIALALSLCGTALAAPMPSNVDVQAFSQRPGSLAGQRYREAHAALSPRASSDSIAVPNVSSSDGLGALVIVLISVGGALALAGAAYASTRVMHHRHGHAAS
jgi:hypothetical protein